MTDVWSERAKAYRESPVHREGQDLDLLVEWAEPGPGVTALDVATGGGHVARRLREADCEVTTCDPSPGMRPDVICRAEELPFADASFDVVATRLAAHHFDDVEAAVAQMARVSRRLVVVADLLYSDEPVEEAERLRDPTHVRCYSEGEWRRLLEGAGLAVEAVEVVVKGQDFAAWLARAGCEEDEAERVRELLADRVVDGGWVNQVIVLKGRRRR